MLTGTRNMFRDTNPDNNSLRNPARRRLLRGAAFVLALVATKFRAVFAEEPLVVADDSIQHLRQTLSHFSFRLFPHDGLPAGTYDDIAAALLSRASNDRILAELLETGVADLNEGGATIWLERAEAQQIDAVRSMEGSSFFRAMRSATIEHLYRNKEVWQLLGYQGSSIEFGGYVDRGFDDIDWLPAEDDRK